MSVIVSSLTDGKQKALGIRPNNTVGSLLSDVLSDAEAVNAGVFMCGTSAFLYLCNATTSLAKT